MKFSEKKLVIELLEKNKEFLVKLLPTAKNFLYQFDDGSKQSMDIVNTNIGKYGRLDYSLSSPDAFDFIRDDNMNGINSILSKPRIVTITSLDALELIDVENSLMYEQYNFYIGSYFNNLYDYNDPNSN